MNDSSETITTPETEQNGYFINLVNEQRSKPPLSDWSTSFKRELLQLEWKNVIADVALEPGTAHKPFDQLTDKEINWIFDEYREAAPEYFAWMENSNYIRHYDDEQIRQNYDILPTQLIDEHKTTQERHKREYGYSYISPQVAVIYNPDMSVDSYFTLNKDKEDQNAKFTLRYGTINQDHLSFFKKLLAENDEKLKYYFQIRESLPHWLVETFEQKVDLHIPDELKKKFDSRSDFENSFEPYASTLIPAITQNQQAIQYLLDSLETLSQERHDIAREKNFGLALENTDQISFFKSFVRHSPDHLEGNKHFSLLYYWHIRRDLPKELVSQFESHFNIKAPQFEFDTSDLSTFLKQDEEIYRLPLLTAGASESEMAMFLYDELDKLDTRINAQKIRPERLTLDEVLKSEGSRLQLDQVRYHRLKENYELLIEPPIRKAIESTFGIQLADYSIREQIQFLNYIMDKSEDEIKSFKDFTLGVNTESNQKTNKNVHNRMKSFLSLEQDEKMGEKIAKMVKALPPETSDAIFAKYAQIVDSTDLVRSYLRESITSQIENPGQVEDQIIQKLLQKGRDILVRYSDSTDLPTEQIIQELEEINAEILLFAGTFKTLKERGENINLEDFAQLSQEITPASELNEATRSELLAIFDKNYSGEANTVDEKQALQAAGRYFRENMVKSFDDPSTRYHIYKIGEHIIAFLRVKDNEDGSSYAGSFNVRPSARSSQIATVLLEKFLDQECAKRPLKIHATCRLRVATHYVNKNRFVCTGLTRPEGVRTELMEMMRYDQDQTEYRYQSVTPANLKNAWLEQNPQNETNLTAESQIIAVDFSNNEQYSHFYSVSQQLFTNGNVISNYVIDPENNAIRYISYEKTL